MAARLYFEFGLVIVSLFVFVYFPLNESPSYSYGYFTTDFYCKSLFPKPLPESDRFSHLRASVKKILPRRHHPSPPLILSGDIELNPGPSLTVPPPSLSHSSSFPSLSFPVLPSSSSSPALPSSLPSLFTHHPLTPSPTTVTSKSKSHTCHNFTVFHLNCRSLLCHYHDLISYIPSVHTDIIALTETWLSTDIADAEVDIPGYQLFRLDRNRHGGGVAIYVKMGLSVKIVSLHPLTNPSGLEVLWLEVSSKFIPSKLLIGCCYRPPSSPPSSLEALSSQIESILLSHRSFILCGDINVDLLDCTNPLCTQLKNIISEFNLIIPIQSPTRISQNRSSLLDVFMLSPDIPITSSSVLDLAATDHLPIIMTTNWRKSKQSSRTVTRRCFKKFNELNFLDDLKRFPWEEMNKLTSPDDKLIFFNEVVTNILNYHAPVKQIRVRKDPVPWITSDIRDQMDKRNRLLKLYRRTKTTALWTEYRLLRNKIGCLIRKSKREYFQTLINKNSHPTVFWKTLKASAKGMSEPYLPGLFNTDASSLASQFNHHFASINSTCHNNMHRSTPAITTSSSPAPLTPLSYLPEVTIESCTDLLRNLDPRKSTGPDNIPAFILKLAANTLAPPLVSVINSSFSSGSFPSSWKQATVKPLHKGGDKLHLSNYRPISILPTPSKLIERIANEHLMNHCKSYLHPLQSSFRPHYSTTTALLHCTNDWHLALDKGLLVGVVFIDVSKAFDSINHRLLISKLSSLGIQGTALDWFTSYLEDRTQQIKIDDSTSCPSNILAGVPQGSILGPALFSLFVNDLPDIIRNSICSMYADDTTIYVTGNSVEVISATLSHCLNSLTSWMYSNHLSLNLTKTKSMLIHSSRKTNLPPLTLSINNTPIEQVTKFKLLGLLITDTLNWNEHISHIVTKVSRHIHLLRRLSKFLPTSGLKLFYNAYILPTFQYCDTVWVGCSSTQANQLERLQNQAGRIILKRRCFDSATKVRQDLLWPTLKSQQKLHLAQLMFKCTNGLAPPYLTEMLKLSTDVHQYHTRFSNNGYILPAVKSELGKKSFCYAGPCTWNSLSQEARGAQNLTIFNGACKSILTY